MHELALAKDILDTVYCYARENGIIKITMIRLIVGPLSGVMPEALEFGLQVLSEEGIAKGAKVEIERPPIVGKCSGCNSRIELSDWEPNCPKCGNPGLQILQGTELRIESFEGD